MHRSPRPLRFLQLPSVLLAAALGAALAACGGVGAPGDGTAPATPPTQPTPSAPPSPTTPPQPPPPAAAAPVVAAINVHGSPPAGGGLLLLAGSGLGNAVSVTFGGAPATDLTFDPAQGTLLVTVPGSPLGPSADGFVAIEVTNADGQAATVPGFHYGEPPVVTGFTPGLGAKGSPVVVTGRGFSADATGPRAGLQVSFGGSLATISARSPTELTATVPKLNPGAYPIVVVDFDGQYSVAAGTFTVPGP